MYESDRVPGHVNNPPTVHPAIVVISAIILGSMFAQGIYNLIF